MADHRAFLSVEHYGKSFRAASKDTELPEKSWEQVQGSQPPDHRAFLSAEHYGKSFRAASKATELPERSREQVQGWGPADHRASCSSLSSGLMDKVAAAESVVAAAESALLVTPKSSCFWERPAAADSAVAMPKKNKSVFKFCLKAIWRAIVDAMPDHEALDASWCQNQMADLRRDLKANTGVRRVRGDSDRQAHANGRPGLTYKTLLVT